MPKHKESMVPQRDIHHHLMILWVLYCICCSVRIAWRSESENSKQGTNRKTPPDPAYSHFLTGGMPSLQMLPSQEDVEIWSRQVLEGLLRYQHCDFHRKEPSYDVIDSWGETRLLSPMGAGDSFPSGGKDVVIFITLLCQFFTF